MGDHSGSRPLAETIESIPQGLANNRWWRVKGGRGGFPIFFRVNRRTLCYSATRPSSVGFRKIVGGIDRSFRSFGVDRISSVGRRWGREETDWGKREDKGWYGRPFRTKGSIPIRYLILCFNTIVDFYHRVFPLRFVKNSEEGIHISLEKSTYFSSLWNVI